MQPGRYHLSMRDKISRKVHFSVDQLTGNLVKVAQFTEQQQMHSHILKDEGTTSGGLVVQWLACWTRGPTVAGSTPGRCIVDLSGNDLGQVVHTNVPLFTKQYNLVLCEGFHVNAPVCGSQWHGSNEQGEYCSSSSSAIGSIIEP